MWPFKSCKCSNELSRAENEAMITAQLMNKDQITQFVDELQAERVNVSHFMDLYHEKRKEVERLQRMCTDLTESAKKFRESEKAKIKPAKVVRQKKIKQTSGNGGATRGHIPEVMD